MSERVGGIIEVSTDGYVYNAKGNFSFDTGEPLREAVVGHDRVHGYKELPKVAFIEGEITDGPTLDLQALANMTNVTCTLKHPNGKIFVWRNAWYAGAMEVNTEEGNLPFRFESASCDEIRP